MAINNALRAGVFVPTNYIWEVQQVESNEQITPDMKNLLIRLYQNIGAIALALNVKDTGQYALSEFVTGQQYFSNPVYNSSTAGNPALRQTYRKVINWTTALKNAGTSTIPHGITCTPTTTFTRIYAVANDTSGNNYIPIPYASPTDADAIELLLDATNVYIITGSDRTNFTITYIVLEYLQS